MILDVLQSLFAACLVAEHRQDSADTDAADTAGNKECGTFHLAGERTTAEPCAPICVQHGGNRHAVRIVLAVKRVLALYHADMIPVSEPAGGAAQGVRDVQIGHSGEFNRGVFACRALGTDRAGRNDQIAAQHIGIHAAGGADADEGVRAAVDELLQRDGGRRSSDSGGAHRDRLTVQQTAKNRKFAVGGHGMRLVEVRCDGLTAPGVSGQNHIVSDVAGTNQQMEFFLGIVRHWHRDLLLCSCCYCQCSRENGICKYFHDKQKPPNRENRFDGKLRVNQLCLSSGLTKSRVTVASGSLMLASS